MMLFSTIRPNPGSASSNRHCHMGQRQHAEPICGARAAKRPQMMLHRDQAATAHALQRCGMTMMAWQGVGSGSQSTDMGAPAVHLPIHRAHMLHWACWGMEMHNLAGPLAGASQLLDTKTLKTNPPTLRVTTVGGGPGMQWQLPGARPCVLLPRVRQAQAEEGRSAAAAISIRMRACQRCVL